jgi:hypothetical protein
LTLIVAGRVRPFPGEVVSGDTWTHFPIEGGTRIVLIDGAGHGPLANEAAEIARKALEELAAQSAEAALKTCHARLHGTRGAVISIVDIGAGGLSFTGVGTVDARLLRPDASQQRLAPDRGLLGASMPRLHIWKLPLETADWRLILFSDGIMQRMILDWEQLQDLSEPDALLDELIERWGRQTDDASIVLAAPAR